MHAIEMARADDVQEAIQRISETDAALYGWMAGNDLASWQRLTAHEWHKYEGVYDHRHCVVIRNAGSKTLLGLMIAFPVMNGFDFNSLQFGLDCREVSEAFIQNLNERWRTATMLFPPLPPRSYYVQNLAVAEAARGMGLGKQLLLHAFEQTQQLDCAACLLDVEKHNPAAHFYEKLGMEMLIETRVPGVSVVGPHFRMCWRVKSQEKGGEPWLC